MKSRTQPEDVAIGKAIRHHRTAAGMSLEALGAAAGVTYQQIQKYETGANRVSASRLLQIASALGCPTGELLALTSAAVTGGIDRDIDVDRLALRLMSFHPAKRRSVVAALSNALDAIDDAIDPMPIGAGEAVQFEGRAM